MHPTHAIETTCGGALCQTFSVPNVTVVVGVAIACTRAGKFMTMKEVRQIEDQKDRARKDARVAQTEAIRRAQQQQQQQTAA